MDYSTFKPKYKSTTLRQSFAKIVSSNTTMADRLDYSDILTEIEYDDECVYDCMDGDGDGDGDRDEDMKSNMWKNKTTSAPPKKRRRTQSRGDTKRFLPSDISYDRFKEVLLAMAYSGVNPKFNFDDWSRYKCPKNAIGDLPCERLSVKTTTNSYHHSTQRLYEVMKSVIPFGKTGWPPVNLYNCLIQLVVTHHLTYSTRIATQGMQCSIDNAPPKGNNGLVLFELQQHRVVKDENGTYKYFEPLVDNRRFLVSTRYDKIIFAFWWLLNLDYLVAKNCHDWIAIVKSMDSEILRDEFPEVISASDTELATIFINEHEEYCREMLDKLVEYTTILDKKTNEMMKRKPILEKNAIAMEEREKKT